MQSPDGRETAPRENLAGRSRKRNSARPRTVIEPQRILELGNGLELWRVHPSALREQDINARAMPKAMFERLAQTIARDNRLESLPLCAKTERGGLAQGERSPAIYDGSSKPAGRRRPPILGGLRSPEGTS
jgi:hypothetical protein